MCKPVDTNSHIVVAHEVTNIGHDRTQLASMSRHAKQAVDAKELTVLVNRGYFSGPQILACEALGVTPICPRPLTSGARAEGRFGKPNFIYQPDRDTYRCPAGETLPRRSTSVEHGLILHRYWSRSCRQCRLKPDCTPGTERRVTRWEHERVIEAMQDRLDQMPEAMRVRRRTIEHIFGTIKDWMGRSHFQMRKLRNVGTEMSLHVLAYNLKRAIALVGASDLIAAMRA
jgi:transposase